MFMIITIGREFACNGRKIGKIVSNKLGIKYYDKESLAAEAKKADMYEELRDFYEEELVNSLLYMIATNNYSQKHGEIPFKFIRDVTAKDSCVLIGRCGNYIFRDNPDAVSIFLHSPKEIRLKRAMKEHNLTHSKAERMLNKLDKDREGFHIYYSNEKWLDANGYHLCIDSSLFSDDEVADIIIDFVNRKFKTKE
jgi:cytidylate kinase